MSILRVTERWRGGTIYFLVWLTSNLLTYKHCYVADLFSPLRQSTRKVQVNVNVKVSALRSSRHMGTHGKQAKFHSPILYLSASCTVPPSTPDGSATIFSETPPPTPFSTHPHYRRFLGNVVNPLHSHMHRETWVRHSDSEPSPIPFSTWPSHSQTDSHTTVANSEGLNRNPSPIQQCLFAVSPSPTAVGWNSSSPASPSCHSCSVHYWYYAVTVGKRTGVFADWYIQHDLCMISLSAISGATESAVLLKEYL